MVIWGVFLAEVATFFMSLAYLRWPKTAAIKPPSLGHFTSKDFPVKISENMVKGSGLVIAK